MRVARLTTPLPRAPRRPPARTTWAHTLPVISTRTSRTRSLRSHLPRAPRRRRAARDTRPHRASRPTHSSHSGPALAPAPARPPVMEWDARADTRVLCSPRRPSVRRTCPRSSARSPSGERSPPVRQRRGRPRFISRKMPCHTMPPRAHSIYCAVFLGNSSTQRSDNVNVRGNTSNRVVM